MGDEVISTILERQINEFIKSSVDDLVPIIRSFDVTFLNTLFNFNDDYTLCYDNLLFNEEFKDISSLDHPESTLVIDESSLLVTSHPASNKLSLREVKRFDPFFSLTQSGGETRVMEIPSFGFHHMPSPQTTSALCESIEKKVLYIRVIFLSKVLQMALIPLDSLPSEWKTHTLIWRNKANLEEHSLDDFTTDSVSAATSVSVVCAQLPMSSHPNIDSLSNVVIFSLFASQSTSPQLDNKDLKQIDVDDFEEIDLRWQMAMLTMRARRKGHFGQECRSPKDTRRTIATEPQRRHVPEEPANFALMAITSSSSSSDNEVQSCSKPCLRAYEQLHSQYDKLTNEFQKSRIDVLSYQAEARDGVLVTLKQKLNQTEKERDDLKLKFDKFQSSSQSLTELLASQKHDKHGLGYYSESDSKSLSLSSLSDRSQPSGEYHDVPPPITRNFMPPKPDLIFHTAFIVVETAQSAFTVQLSPAKPAQDISHATRPMAPIIEDWVSDSEDEFKPNDPQSAPSFVQTFEHVKPSGHSAQPIEAPILDATPKPTSSKTNGSSKRKNRKTCFVYRGVDHLIKDCNFYAKPKTASSTKKYPQKHIVPAAVLTKSKPVSITYCRPISAVVPNIMGNPQYALKDKGVIDSG
nr:ribonuclease H-like domain-containing protein [Tanacetum cinerariifolium]